MKVEEMFSRRNAFHAPQTLWENALPEEFLFGLKNVLENCFVKSGFQFMWVRVSNALGWPRNRVGDFVFAHDDETLDEFVAVAEQRPWYERLDSVEIIGVEIKNTTYVDFNSYREQVNYLFEIRDINWMLDENSKLVKRVENIAVIEKAISESVTGFETAGDHIKKAWDLFNTRPTPDLANCVKEAVMAVESAVVGLSGEKKGTLSEALKKLALHPALAQSLEKLYGYRGDAPGIAHGASTPPDVSRSEAELVLTVCAGLVTFLRQCSIEKQAKN